MNTEITAYNTPFGSIIGRFLSEHYGLFITSFVPCDDDFVLTVTNGRQFTIFRDVFDDCIRTGELPLCLIDNLKADLNGLRKFGHMAR